ncbi:MAG: bifunctional riboflavin kinase/FAD synthetase [Ignavibacteria bacterium]|nr:bifunctional riboflavin kinase/FAD synthetase [Ignavibacteria bacterium]
MIVVRSLQNIQSLSDTVVTVGTYDGVHKGHQKIFSEVMERAKRRKTKSVFVTFEPHPKEVIRKTSMHLLSTLNERIEQMKHWMPDVVFVVNFTNEFSQLSPREFYEQYIVNGFHAAEVVEGNDHMFGHNREAGIKELQEIGKEFRFEVFVVPKVSVNGEEVSSTHIRNLLEQGNIEKANQCLGYPYRFSGEIIRGDGRGKELGFPTANINALSKNKLIPLQGVYVVRGMLDGSSYNGMLNIGTRPTFYEHETISVEVHLFDMNKELYGKEITIEFLKRLREDKKFSTKEALTEQLHRDKQQSIQYLQII